VPRPCLRADRICDRPAAWSRARALGGTSGRWDVIDVVVGSPGAVVEIDALSADEGAGNACDRGR
jgi:hypothetical protein